MKSERIMESQPAPYHLRSRGRAVGRYMLRRRGQGQGVSYAPKASIFANRHRSRRSGVCSREESSFDEQAGSLNPIKEEQKSGGETGASSAGWSFAAGEDSSNPNKQEEEDSRHEIEYCYSQEESSSEEEADISNLAESEIWELERQKNVRDFLRETHRHPFLALDHFNRHFKGDYIYKFVNAGTELCFAFPGLGFLSLMHIKAKPKPRQKSSNVSVNDPSLKHFFAQFHELPDGTYHVSDCIILNDPPKPGVSISSIIPVCCLVCKLDSEAAFQSKSRSILEEKARSRGEKSADGSGDPDPKELYPLLERRICNCGNRPSDGIASSSPRGGKKH